MEETQLSPRTNKSAWPAAVGALSKSPQPPRSSSNACANSGTDSSVPALNVYDFFAKLGKRVINPGGIAGRNRLLAALDIQPGSRVLEIGCGSGHTACYLAERFHCQVTAVDLSAGMIAAARQRVTKAGLQAQVRCETADIAGLPFAEHSFDYVIVQAVLMFVDKARALTEIQRVLKPGGQFGAIEFAWHQPPPDAVRDGTHQVCGCRVLEFHTCDEWASWLQRLRYQGVQSQEHAFALLSIPGFVRDEGIINCLRILSRVLRQRGSIPRMVEIWGHFARHRAHFCYVLMTARTCLAH